MFWFFETRQKVPARKVSLVVLLFATIVVLGTLALPKAEARPRFRDAATGWRLRLSGTYGFIDYDAISRASNTRTTFSSAPYLGRRGEIEKWFPMWERPWPMFGLRGDLEVYPVRLFGQAIYYSSGGASLAWRLAGRWGNWNKNELVLSVGPNVQTFPDVRTVVRTTHFDLIQAGVLGVKAQLTYRFALSQNHRKWRADVGGYWIQPMSLYQTSSSELDKQQTRSFGFALHLDRNITDHFDAGLGLLYQKNRLGYRPIESNFSQTIEWNNLAPVFSIQFWF